MSFCASLSSCLSRLISESLSLVLDCKLPCFSLTDWSLEISVSRCVICDFRRAKSFRHTSPDFADWVNYTTKTVKFAVLLYYHAINISMLLLYFYDVINSLIKYLWVVMMLKKLTTLLKSNRRPSLTSLRLELYCVHWLLSPGQTTPMGSCPICAIGMSNIKTHHLITILQYHTAWLVWSLLCLSYWLDISPYSAKKQKHFFVQTRSNSSCSCAACRLSSLFSCIHDW